MDISSISNDTSVLPSSRTFRTAFINDEADIIVTVMSGFDETKVSAHDTPAIPPPIITKATLPVSISEKWTKAETVNASSQKTGKNINSKCSNRFSTVQGFHSLLTLSFPFPCHMDPTRIVKWRNWKQWVMWIVDQCFNVIITKLIDMTALISAAFDMLTTISGCIWCCRWLHTMVMVTNVATWWWPLMCLWILQQFKASVVDRLITSRLILAWLAKDKCVKVSCTITYTVRPRLSRLHCFIK